MRQVTEKYNVYTFDELSEEVQEKVLDSFREGEDFPFLSESLSDYLEKLLKEYKITYDELPKVYYSLNYCQGDGAMFEGVVYWKSYTATIQQSGHYYHYNSKTIDLESTKTGKYATEETDAKFNDIYVEICRKLEKYGYDEIEYLTSDEVIKENIESNEYEFTEDGKIA